ncbi:MAG: biotin--[acetyl-CoA-carboxylase] ligase family protein [Bacteroidales bacterium]|nr:biotin--[acetyl-CoA-carboxylase] ligase family protein [Bacteroidales bacterium]
MGRKYGILWYDEVDSTNSEAQRRLSELDNLTVIAARSQVAGRGQRGNVWYAVPNENLTFSLFLKFGAASNSSEGEISAPKAGNGVSTHRSDSNVFPVISAKRQNFLNMAIALGVAEYLSDEHGLPAKIKWPNDIYVGDCKICGILIENTLRGDLLTTCTVGIGLNVNQKNFPADIPNPTSMTLLTGQTYNIEEELGKLMSHIDRRIGKVFGAKARFRLHHSYIHRLYRWNEPHDYLVTATSERLYGAIRGITSHGQLVMEDVEDSHWHCRHRIFNFKEVEFII